LCSYSCERLTTMPQNHELIKKFESKRGAALVQYMVKRGWDLDKRGENAFYLIKNPQGIPCLFFALKCGALYAPINEEEIRKNYKAAERTLRLLGDQSDDNPARLALLNDLEEIRQSHNKTREEIVTAFSLHLLREKSKSKDFLSRLDDDKAREGERPIQRVNHTFPGVELTHFCVNDLTKEEWKEHGFRFPMGEVLFWWFIAPIFYDLQKLVGCQYIFLFAADPTPDGTLTNYYNVSLKFSKETNIGTSKPQYDWCCELMSQEVNALLLNRELFFERFNLDPEEDIV